MQKIKFKKFNTEEEVFEYLEANGKHKSKSLATLIWSYADLNQEFAIIQEHMFDGYRVSPCWELTDMRQRINSDWHRWYTRENEYLPCDMFDLRTMKDYEIPYGFLELHNVKSLFRIDPKLSQLFDSLPQCNLHTFLRNYHNGILDGQAFSEDVLEWPVSLSTGITDPTRVGFFTVNKLYEMLKQQANGYSEHFDKSISISENMKSESLRESKGVIATFGRALEKLIRSGYYHPWSTSERNMFEDSLLFNGPHANKFEVWDAKDIPKAYHWSSYAEDCGTLGHSCMRSESDKKKVEFYAQMGDSVKILVLLNSDNLVLGRAILWQKCYNRRRKDSFKVMDRVYTVRNSYEILFHRWAVDNHVIRKKLNSYTNNTLIQPNGKGGIGACYIETPKDIKQRLNMVVQNLTNNYNDRIEIPEEEYQYLPWLDTFKFYDHIAGSFVTHKTMGGHFKCQSTTGHLQRDRNNESKSYDLQELMRSKRINS